MPTDRDGFISVSYTHLDVYKRQAQDYTLNLLVGAEYKENKGVEASLAGQRFLLEGDFYKMCIRDRSYTEFDAIQIGIASPEQIREWSYGERCV